MSEESTDSRGSSYWDGERWRISGPSGATEPSATIASTSGRQSPRSQQPATTETSQQPAAGWYDDPEGDGLRYWDGRQWTEDRRPARPADPKAIKQATRSLHAAVDQQRAAFSAALRELNKAARTYSADVDRARQGIQTAAEGRKLKSIGVIRKVTLFEDRIAAPGIGTRPLTPEVKAHSEQHGTKQSVQGWVFKSDQENREVYLHLDGPDWAQVVPFNIKNSFSRPQDLHQFASAVNLAARNVAQAHQQIAARKAAAEAEYRRVVTNRESIRAAAKQAESTAAESDDVRTRRAELDALLANAGDGNAREIKKAREETARVEAFQQSWQEQAEQAVAYAAEISAFAEAVASVKETSAPVAADAPVQVPAGKASEPFESQDVNENEGHEPSEGDSPTGDPLDQIQKLGQLRDAGLITDDEFASKKADLLSRL